MSPVLVSGGESYEVEVEQHGNGFVIRVDGEELEVESARFSGGAVELILDGGRIRVPIAEGGDGELWVSSRQRDVLIEPAEEAGAGPAAAAGGGLTAPMPGTVLELRVVEGDAVEQGDTLLVLEAMKMENDVTAPADGTVTALPFAEGERVERGDLLVEFEADEQ